jgi:hypothetical protein
MNKNNLGIRIGILMMVAGTILMLVALYMVLTIK